MKTISYTGRSILSFVSFNVGWWACALGPKYGMPWLGPATLPLFVGVHLYYSPTPLGEGLFVAALAVFGFFFDTLMIFSGIFHVIPATDWTPPWLVSMWVLFGLTFESMLVMRRSRWLTCMAGVMSGPLSYLFAQAVNLLVYREPYWLAVGAHGLIWAVLMPFLFAIRDSMVRFGLGGSAGGRV